MKITIDTNVLLSATFWEGDSQKIIDKVENKDIELILSESIIEEFIRVFNYEEIQNKIKDKNLEMKRTVEEIMAISKIVEPTEKLDIVKEDPDDNKILECALEGNVDYIITKDSHLLKLEKFRGIRIATPEEFLKLFMNRK